MGAAIGLSLAASVCWIAFALILSVVIARVFVDGGALGSVDVLLLGMLGLAIVRGVLLWGGEVIAQRAAGQLQTDLRARLAAALVALGPTAVRGERIGELVYTAGEGIESLDPYVTRYVPARALAVLVPALVAIVVAALDPWSVVILLIA
ncbi:MAG TPA: ABC transporter transmembrane domain-containing protein, partial [Actinomycetota bacterium]|nr:ABC transporter transmembrane domain-containing protein [Actinomycetota bacterium]